MTLQQSVLLIGASQLILAIALVIAGGGTDRLKTPTVGFMACYAVTLVANLEFSIHAAVVHPLLLPVFFAAHLGLGPLLYLHTLGLVAHTRPRLDRAFYMFAAAGVVLALSTIVWTFVPLDDRWILVQSGSSAVSDAAAQIMRLISTVIFCGQALIFVFWMKSFALVRRAIPASDRSHTSLLAALLALLCVWSLDTARDMFALLGNSRALDSAVATAESLVIFALCVQAAYSGKHQLTEDVGVRLPRAANSYQKSALTAQDVGRIANKIERAFKEDRIYRRSDLSLQNLAKDIAEPSYYVSQAMSQHFRETFYSIVSRHRVEEACQLLKCSRSRSILETAYAVGFNSKSAFNSSFKSLKGKTPSQYRNQVSQQG